MREKPILFSTEMVKAILDGRKTVTRRVVKPQPSEGKLPKCPYQPGDILWVRETWNYSPNWYYCYKADTIPDDNHGYIGSIPWRPSIFMPRAAARLFLLVKNVWAERLQDITPKSIVAEGLPSFIVHPKHEHYKNVCWNNWLRFEWFHELWDSLNKKRGYPWDSNPWVWVIEFERTEAI